MLRTGGQAPSGLRSLAIALGAGLVAALFVAPLAGVLVAAVVLLELLVDRSRILVVAGTVGTLVVTVGYVALHQHRNAFIPDINWPAHMGLANSLVWVAVFLLASDGLVSGCGTAPAGRAEHGRSASVRASSALRWSGTSPDPVDRQVPRGPAPRVAGGRSDPSSGVAAGSAPDGDRRHQAIEFFSRRAGFSTMK